MKQLYIRYVIINEDNNVNKYYRNLLYRFKRTALNLAKDNERVIEINFETMTMKEVKNEM